MVRGWSTVGLMLLALLRGPASAAAQDGRAAQRPAVLLIHGGAWTTVGEAARHSMDGDARRLRALGWSTEEIDHHPGAEALTDVVAAYDGLRHRLGRETPICAYGASSGGHLALMLATRRLDVACVIAEGAPTDLPTLTGPVADYAHRYFDDAGGLAAWSPARRAISTRVLLVHALDDGVVGVDQAARFKETHPATEVVSLAPGGSSAYVHCRVAARDVRRWHRAERSLLSAVEQGAEPATTGSASRSRERSKQRSSA
jgi:dipeptidyl aminopeptidase/acylaminoacyl peptidase